MKVIFMQGNQILFDYQERNNRRLLRFNFEGTLLYNTFMKNYRDGHITGICAL